MIENNRSFEILGYHNADSLQHDVGMLLRDNQSKSDLDNPDNSYEKYEFVIAHNKEDGKVIPIKGHLS